MREVVGLYRGELAAGQPWPWLTPLRERLRRLVINTYARLATDHPHEAATLWHTAAQVVDPVNEHVHQRAVHALTGAGHHDTAAALVVEHAQHLAATQPMTGL
ncbi:hypothetical protein [Phytohabitans houttuyneae]|uniref:Bacterial transcriptional activator domain-containing protein n=1 Tax=Phytohabitans houttuyneae TaxID=1076126 RepID=A0A6V8KRS2_9ACTN|nr:hypothetical protein [Phytohabitans houttuyneae]GFJ84979.1 hypothetical protein Phou_091590 [Phytohabitans houttuyneae]